MVTASGAAGGLAPAINYASQTFICRHFRPAGQGPHDTDQAAPEEVRLAELDPFGDRIAAPQLSDQGFGEDHDGR